MEERVESSCTRRFSCWCSVKKEGDACAKNDQTSARKSAQADLCQILNFNLFSSFDLTQSQLSFLPNNKILDWTKLKAFADGKTDFAKIMIYVYDRVENIVGKGEHAGYQHVLLFPQCFQKASLSGSLKVGILW